MRFENLKVRQALLGAWAIAAGLSLTTLGCGSSSAESPTETNDGGPSASDASDAVEEGGDAEDGADTDAAPKERAREYAFTLPPESPTDIDLVAGNFIAIPGTFMSVFLGDELLFANIPVGEAAPASKRFANDALKDRPADVYFTATPITERPAGTPEATLDLYIDGSIRLFAIVAYDMDEGHKVEAAMPSTYGPSSDEYGMSLMNVTGRPVAFAHYDAEGQLRLLDERTIGPGLSFGRSISKADLPSGTIDLALLSGSTKGPVLARYDTVTLRTGTTFELTFSPPRIDGLAPAVAVWLTQDRTAGFTSTVGRPPEP